MKPLFRDPSQVFFGGLILALGVGFLLDSLGILNFGTILSEWWPTIFILFGLSLILTNTRSIYLPGVFIVLGFLLLLDSLNIVNYNFWQIFWPLLLVFIGFRILIRSGNSSTSSDKSVNSVALFSGDERNLNTKDFEGGNITALFGGSKLDFRKATFAKDATISVFTAFGGVEIIVPEDTNVIVSGLPLFGGFEDKTVKPDKPKGTLRITGTVLFGGVSVKN